MKTMESIIGNILFSGETKTESIEEKFTTLLKTHSFLQNNDFLLSLFRISSLGKTFSDKQKEAAKKVLNQWENKKVLRYLKIISKYPFVKSSDRVNAFNCLTSGILLNEKQLRWIDIFIENYRDKKYLFIILKSLSDNLKLPYYHLQLENRLIDEGDLYDLCAAIEDPELKIDLKFKYLVLASFAPAYKNDNSAFKSQLANLIHKRVPLTNKQYDSVLKIINPKVLKRIKEVTPQFKPNKHIRNGKVKVRSI